MTTIMLILILLGIAAAIAGIVIAAIRGWRLYGVASDTQKQFDTELRVLTEKQELAMRRVEKIQTDQLVLQERLEVTKGALERVGVLVRELTAARARLNLLG